MRFASMAVLMLLAAGCGHETVGTPAAEPAGVAATPGPARPAAEPGAPPKPPVEPDPAAAPNATPLTPVAPPAAESPRGAAQLPTPQPVVQPDAPATPRALPVAPPALSATAAVPLETPASKPPVATTPPAATSPAAAPVTVAEPQPTAARSAAPRAETPAPPDASPPAATAPVTAAEPPATVQELDLKALEDQLRQTKAIGFMTKLTLKGQVNDLLDRFREYYQGKAKMTMKDLRRSYDLLMMKVLSLIQDADQQLASAIVASREAIWGLLADPVKFETLQG